MRFHHHRRNRELKGIETQHGRGIELRHHLWKSDDVAAACHRPGIVHKHEREEKFWKQLRKQQAAEQVEFPDIETKIDFLLAGISPAGKWLLIEHHLRIGHDLHVDEVAEFPVFEAAI